jgi:pimeloyl-ACP methyl ester carboxylesterase
MESLDIEHRGRVLRGTLHLPETTPAPAVVLCHGFGGTRVEFGYTFVRLAKRLARQGLAVYRFDFAGGGESDGDFADLAVSDQVDQAVAVLDALAAHPAIDADRLSLLGMSMGGLTASLAAAERPVRALALWAPAAAAVTMDETAADRRNAAIAEHGYDDFGGLPIHRHFVEDAAGIDAFADAAGYTGPVLLAVGSDDPVVPPHLLDGYRKLYGDRVDVQVFDGIGHGFETVPVRARLLELSEAFLLQHA